MFSRTGKEDLAHFNTLLKVTLQIAAGLGMALRGLNPKGRIFFHSFPRLTAQSSGLEGSCHLQETDRQGDLFSM